MFLSRLKRATNAPGKLIDSPALQMAQRENTDGIPLTLTLHPHNHRSIILKNFKSLQKDWETGTIFSIISLPYLYFSFSTSVTLYFFFQSQALQGIFNGCNSLSKIWIVTNQEVSLQTQIDTKNQTQQSSQLNGKKENFSLSQWELKVTRQCSSAGKRMWSSDNSFPLCVLLVEEVVGNFLTNQGALWSKKKNGLALEIQLKIGV